MRASQTLNETIACTEFTEDENQLARELAGYQRAGEKAQDSLVWADYQFVGTYGLSIQWRWASGRQDSYNYLDIPDNILALQPPEWFDSIQTWLGARDRLRHRLREKVSRGQHVDHGARTETGKGAGAGSCHLPGTAGC